MLVSTGDLIGRLEVEVEDGNAFGSAARSGDRKLLGTVFILRGERSKILSRTGLSTDC